MGITAEIFSGFEPSPQCGTDPQCVEIIGRNNAPSRTLGPVADGKRNAGDSIHDESVKKLAVPLKILEIRPG